MPSSALPRLTLAALLAACSGPSASVEFVPLSCAPDRPAAGVIVEMSTGLGLPPRPALGACGVLHYVDAAGDLFVEGPALVASAAVAEGISGYAASRRGEQRIVFRGGQVQWQGPGGATSDWHDADVGGFVREGQTERAWICGGGQLATLDGDGASVLADDVILCPNVVAAPDAPLLAYVAADTELRVLDVATGGILDLSEVPFIATSDRVAFSDDGLFLFHEATRAATPRLGIFDLRLGRGARFIAAPQVSRGLSGIVRAPGQGHVLAFPATDGVVALTADGFLNSYEGATLLSLSPDGERLLLLFAPSYPSSSYSYEVADLAGLSLAPVASYPEPPTQVLASPDGQRVLLGLTRGLVEWSWAEAEMRSRGVPGAPRSVAWIGDDGALLLSDRGGRVFLADPADAVLGGVEDVWMSGAWATPSGPLALVVDDGGGGARLLHFAQGSGAPRVLHEALQISDVQLDEAGERLSFIASNLDEDDPTLLRSGLYAGAVP